MSSMLLMTACASLPGAGDDCGGAPSSAVLALESDQTELAANSGCPSRVVSSRFQTAGGVQQRGSQTRTVGVPRGFLVAMIVLLLIFGLA